MIRVENTVHISGSIQRTNLYPSVGTRITMSNTITNLITVSIRNNAYRDLMPKINDLHRFRIDHIETATNIITLALVTQVYNSLEIVTVSFDTGGQLNVHIVFELFRYGDFLAYSSSVIPISCDQVARLTCL